MLDILEQLLPKILKAEEKNFGKKKNSEILNMMWSQ